MRLVRTKSESLANQCAAKAPDRLPGFNHKERLLLALFLVSALMMPHQCRLNLDGERKCCFEMYLGAGELDTLGVQTEQSQGVAWMASDDSCGTILNTPCSKLSQRRDQLMCVDGIVPGPNERDSERARWPDRPRQPRGNARDSQPASQMPEQPGISGNAPTEWTLERAPVIRLIRRACKRQASSETQHAVAASRS